MFKPFRFALLFAIALSLLVTGSAFARSMQQGENCQVPAGMVIEGTLFTLCQNLSIAGRVEGNVIGIGLRTIISGEVGGNVYLAGMELDLPGRVEGDLHYVGLMLELGSAVEPASPVFGQVLFATLSTEIKPASAIHGAVTGLGYQLVIDGQVGGEVNFWGSAFALDSVIAGDVYAAVGNPEADAADLETLLLPLNMELAVLVPGLSISSRGRIQGELAYVGPAEALIEGEVDGSISYEATPAIIPSLPEPGFATLFVDQFRRELAVLLTVGLLGLALAGPLFGSSVSYLRWKPVASFVIGMLLFILSFPITLILLLISGTIILVLALLHLDGVLLVLASFLAVLDIGMIGIFYFAAIFLARGVFALGLGRLILRFVLGQRNTRQMPRLSLLVGAVVLALLTSLPVIGFLFNAAALFMGLGAIASIVTTWLHNFRESQYRRSQAIDQRDTPSFYPQENPAQPQLPMQSGGRATPPAQSNELQGLENLPPGFDPDLFFDDD